VDDGLRCSSNARKFVKMIDFLNKEFEIMIGSAKVYVGSRNHKNQDLKLIYLN
jgi:hypothetical protein